MSYEGYSQFLCSKGHYWILDAYEIECLDLEEIKCPVCKGSAVWENMVNLTNGSFDEDDKQIDGYIDLKIKYKKTGFCSSCGEEHICETLYEMPKKKEVNKDDARDE